MFKAATLSLAGQQKQMKEWESTCLPTQHSHDNGERNAGSWKLVPCFHKLLASTWQLFSLSYCSLHVSLEHLM